MHIFPTAVAARHPEREGDWLALAGDRGGPKVSLWVFKGILFPQKRLQVTYSTTKDKQDCKPKAERPNPSKNSTNKGKYTMRAHTHIIRKMEREREGERERERRQESKTNAKYGD